MTSRLVDPAGRPIRLHRQQPPDDFRLTALLRGVRQAVGWRMELGYRPKSVVLSAACLTMWTNSARRSLHPKRSTRFTTDPRWHAGPWDAIWVYERPAKGSRVGRTWTYFSPAPLSDAQAELYRAFRRDEMDPKDAVEAAELLV